MKFALVPFESNLLQFGVLRLILSVSASNVIKAEGEVNYCISMEISSFIEA